MLRELDGGQDGNRSTQLTVDDRGGYRTVDPGLGIHVILRQWQATDNVAWRCRHDASVRQQEPIDRAPWQLLGDQGFHMLVLGRLGGC